MYRQGTIFDIKEFAVHDGPGVRQTVFLKGCPLRCNWCHNPEGLAVHPQIMVSRNGCRQCRKCAAVCGNQSCIGCGECVKVCPERLRRISGRNLSSRELADVLLKNAEYYANCGGGVTFSGGEPLLQWEFVCETMDLLPGVHKAVETSGYASETAFMNLISRTDFVMMDMKIFDEEMHKLHTGVSNRPIKGNLERLKDSGKPFVIRIPVIPGVNDTWENFSDTALLLKDAEHLVRVELLPYHKTAGAKYSMVNMNYIPRFDVNCEPKLMPEIFEKLGIECRIM